MFRIKESGGVETGLQRQSAAASRPARSEEGDVSVEGPNATFTSENTSARSVRVPPSNRDANIPKPDIRT